MMWLQQNLCEGSHAEEEKSSKRSFFAEGPPSASSAQHWIQSLSCLAMSVKQSVLEKCPRPLWVVKPWAWCLHTNYKASSCESCCEWTGCILYLHGLFQLQRGQQTCIVCMSRAGTKRHCVLISINNSSSIQVNKSMAFGFDNFGDILGAFPA